MSACAFCDHPRSEHAPGGCACLEDGCKCLEYEPLGFKTTREIMQDAWIAYASSQLDGEAATWSVAVKEAFFAGMRAGQEIEKEHG